MKKTIKNIKENDVFHARWKERVSGDQKDHCFEGLLIAMKNAEGVTKFVDTFWGICRWDNKTFTFSELNEKFVWEYYCNLDELEKIKSYDRDYYADEDIYWLHDQHACVDSCKYYYIKKGVKRNKDKILRVLEENIKKAENDIERKIRSIKSWSEKKKEVEGGKLDIYI